ncbi:MAG: ABC transporter ATP-binding protein [bacterium]|nr:ABC transporter ATP-binding protein [bacterium]
MDPIYELDRVEQFYHHRPVLSIDHLLIGRGSILGLIGPNGSGKSTLLRLLGLIEKPSRGTVRFDGRPVQPFAPGARSQVALLPQDPCLMKRTVYMNIAYGLKIRKHSNHVEGAVHRALARVGMPPGDFAGRPWYALSSGEALRVALAARLALQPRVLLLDEPTAGVDTASIHRIKEAALFAQREWGTTLVIASHDRPWLYQVCSDVIQLFKGRVFDAGEETILLGPWTRFSDGTWGQRLSDNQHLRIPRPPEPEAAAVVGNIRIAERAAVPAPDVVYLKGIVSQLNLKEKMGQVFAAVAVESHSFTVPLTDRQMSRKTIYPGQIVHLHYRLDKIRWI